MINYNQWLLTILYDGQEWLYLLTMVDDDQQWSTISDDDKK